MLAPNFHRRRRQGQITPSIIQQHVDPKDEKRRIYLLRERERVIVIAENDQKSRRISMLKNEHSEVSPVFFLDGWNRRYFC